MSQSSLFPTPDSRLPTPDSLCPLLFITVKTYNLCLRYSMKSRIHGRI
ncbi:MAG: hypothetical protein F6K26_07055 [Moorea sp. SIO2I5]|nr:hypothetical protein [Moorena sp. SIO2I5]